MYVKYSFVRLFLVERTGTDDKRFSMSSNWFGCSCFALVIVQRSIFILLFVKTMDNRGFNGRSRRVVRCQDSEQ